MDIAGILTYVTDEYRSTQLVDDNSSNSVTNNNKVAMLYYV